MKAEDIREWDNVEIRARLGELREEKFRLRFQMGTMQLENPKIRQHVRRDVARLSTILRERELAETSTEAALPTTEAASPTTEAASPPETAETHEAETTTEAAETPTEADLPSTEAAEPTTEAAEPPETEE